MKRLFVESKWTKTNKYNRKCREVIGKAHFIEVDVKNKFVRDMPIRVRIWHTVHAHSEHSSCLRSPSWFRAGARSCAHYPRFEFQHDWMEDWQ